MDFHPCGSRLIRSIPAFGWRRNLGEQKKRNPNLQPRTKEAYIKWLTDMKLGPPEWMNDVLKANSACTHDPKSVHIPADTPTCEIKGTMSQGIAEQQVPAITVAEVRRRVEMNQLDGTVILDVREPAELKGELGAIQGSLNIPVGQVAQRLKELETFKEKEIVTICRSGVRAHTAAAILLKAGFRKVFNMSGGMAAFRQAEKRP